MAERAKRIRIPRSDDFTRDREYLRYCKSNKIEPDQFHYKRWLEGTI